MILRQEIPHCKATILQLKKKKKDSKGIKRVENEDVKPKFLML